MSYMSIPTFMPYTAYYQPAPRFWREPMMAYGVPATQQVVPSVAPSQLQWIDAEQLKNRGNELRKSGMYKQAQASYEAAIRVNPHYTDAYYNLAQLHVLTGNLPAGIKTLVDLLHVDANDHDARVVLGEYLEKTGNTQEAKKRYMEVLSVKPDFDPARRRLNYLLYKDQEKFYPDTAHLLLQTQNREVIYKARELLAQYYTIHRPNPVLKKLSQEIPIFFEDTQVINESANLAEYDAYKHAIRIQPQMLFSVPNVVGAYLAHELIHALDQDPVTSVLEEQDSYRDLAHFWGIYQGADNDPNLDRALALYQKSFDSLDQEVRRVYTIQDPGVKEKSPGHGLPANSPLTIASQYHDSQHAVNNRERLRRLLAYSSGIQL